MAAVPRLAFSAVILALPLWLAHATSAHACTPPVSVSPDPLGDNVASADLIAIGTIGEMLILPPGSILHPEALGELLPLEVKFHVTQYLKNAGESTLLIYRPTDQVIDEGGRIVGVRPFNSCDSFFPKPGDQYVLFLRRAAPLRYQADVAIPITSDTTSLIADVRAAVIRRSGLPGTGVERSSQRSSSSQLVPLFAFGALAVATSVLFFEYRRWRDR